MKPVNHIDRFKVGTVFVGIINKHIMEILQIKQTPLVAPNGRCYLGNKRAVIFDRKTGRTFESSHSHLAYCKLRILEQKEM